jgi:hypothetical protein
MDHHKNTIYSFRKYYRVSQHIQFLNACILNEVIPKFCQIPDKVNNSTKITPKERVSLEKRKLSKELENQTQKALFYKNAYEIQKDFVSTSLNSPTDLLDFISNIEKTVKISEAKSNTDRNKKLAQLISSNDPYYIKTKIINMTDVSLPTDVESLLELGPNNPIGGYVRHQGSETYLGLDSLFKKVKYVARKNGINELNIESLRCKITLTGQELSFCNTKDARVEKFLKFKNEHPNLIFLKCDKSKNICLLYLKDYLSKMHDLFQNESDFLKIQNFNLTKTMGNFKLLLKNTINKSLRNISQLTIKPQMSISTLYGTVKDHKPNFPLRPIGTSYDSLTLGAEKYINNLLSPLRKNCTYAIKSQIEFKNEFLKIKPQFDPQKHEIFSLDVNSLFPNMNNTRTINYILNEVFKDPKKYFFEKDKHERDLPIPTREKFRKFLHGVLNDFNIFQCHIGIFSQKKGVKMGSPLSSLFADLFLGILERTVVAKLERQGHVLKWLRYADDCIIIAKKGSFNYILDKVNKWDKNIKFSYEIMVDNELTFLSSTIFLTNNTYEFRPSRKKWSRYNFD